MLWVFKGITSVILDVLRCFLSLFANDYIQKFGINIGSKFSSINGKTHSLASVLQCYFSNESLIVPAKTQNIDPSISLFDRLFPLHTLKGDFIAIGIALATIILAFNLYKAITSPEAEHPLSAVGNYVYSCVFIYFSYPLFLIAEYVANEIYIGINDSAVGMLSANEKATFTDCLANVFTPEKLDSKGTVTKQITEVYSTASGAVNPANGLIALVMTIFMIILLIAITVNFLELLLEIIERYLVLGTLFYSAPIACSALASKSTKPIFSAWLRMVFSEFMLMSTNIIFITGFFAGLKYIYIHPGSSMLEYTVYMFMLLAWLLLGQRFDSHLKTLGLSTAQTGGGLLRSAVGAMATARAVKNVASGTITAGTKAAATVGKFANKSSAANAAEGFKGLSSKTTQAMAGKDANLQAVAKAFGEGEGIKNPDDFKKMAANVTGSNAFAGDMNSSSFKSGNGVATFTKADGSKVSIATPEALNRMSPANQAKYANIAKGGAELYAAGSNGAAKAAVAGASREAVSKSASAISKNSASGAVKAGGPNKKPEPYVSASLDAERNGSASELLTGGSYERVGFVGAKNDLSDISNGYKVEAGNGTAFMPSNSMYHDFSEQEFGKFNAAGEIPILDELAWSFGGSDGSVLAYDNCDLLNGDDEMSPFMAIPEADRKNCVGFSMERSSGIPEDGILADAFCVRPEYIDYFEENGLSKSFQGVFHESDECSFGQADRKMIFIPNDKLDEIVAYGGGESARDIFFDTEASSRSIDDYMGNTNSDWFSEANEMIGAPKTTQNKWFNGAQEKVS